MKSGIRTALTLVAALAVVGLPSTAGAALHSHATDWAGPSFCAQYQTRYTGTSFDGVAVCGTTSSGVIRHDGVKFSADGFTCLELIARYYDYVTGRPEASGITSGGLAAFLDGTTGYGVNPESENHWDQYYNGSLQPGEIISMKVGSGTLSHAGIVISVSVNTSDNGVIRYMDQGGSFDGVDSITVSDGQLSSASSAGPGDPFTEFQWTQSLFTDAHPLDNQAHHLCLDAVASGSNQPGDPVELYTCTNGTYQLWRRSGTELVNEVWSLCLEANPATDGKDHGSILLAKCNGASYQQWLSDGSAFVNEAHRLCLDAKAETDAQSGGVVELYACNGGVTQEWPRVLGTYLTTHPSACSTPGGSNCDTNGFFAPGPMGSQFNIQCQTSAGGRIYDRTSSGWYTPDEYANTPGNSAFSPGLPRC